MSFDFRKPPQTPDGRPIVTTAVAIDDNEQVILPRTTSSGDQVSSLSGSDGLIIDVVESDEGNRLLVEANISTPIEERKYDTRITEWDSNICIPNNSWTDVYTLDTVDSVFYGSIFHLNSRNLYFRMIVNGETAIDLDLEELYEQYHLRCKGGGSSSGNCSEVVDWPLVCFSTNRWRLRANTTVVSSSIVLRLKAKSGTKKVYRGMSWWGV